MLLLPLGLLDRLFAPAPAPDRSKWIGSRSYAHRGLHGGGAIENSPTAFARAIEAGLGIECDVRLSSDDRAIVFHDAELDRLTNRRGKVASRSLVDLAAIPLKGSSETIPALPEVLAQVAGRVPLLLELKTGRAGRVGPLCCAVWQNLQHYRGEVAVMSFDPRVSAWFAAQSPKTLRGLVVSEDGARGGISAVKRHIALWRARPDFLAYDIRVLTGRFPSAQKQRGIPLLTWTVRNATQRHLATHFGAAVIGEGEGLA